MGWLIFQERNNFYKKNKHFICKDKNTLEEFFNLENKIVGSNDQLETAEERNNDINLDEEVPEHSGERVAAASRKKKKKSKKKKRIKAPPPVSISLPHPSDNPSTVTLTSSAADTVTGIFIMLNLQL